MVEERRPTRRVVKKVVKKTVVVRPIGSGSTRPGSTKLKTQAPRPTDQTVSTPFGRLKAKTAARPRPSIRIPSPPRRPGAGLASRARLLGSRVTDIAQDASFTVADTTGRSLRWLRNLRLPLLSPLPAAAVAGVLAGALAVTLGWLSIEIFSAAELSAGGGRGALALVIVAILTYGAGALLLSGFGAEHARVISSVAIMLVLLLVLMFFLRLAAGTWAWVLIPALGMIGFMMSSFMIRLAADQPPPRR